MSLGSMFLIACVWILFRDRKDWFNYVIVILATLFFGDTRFGNGIGPILTSWATSIDAWIVGLLNNAF